MAVGLSVAATSMAGTAFPKTAWASGGKSFDPQTVLWTDNLIEEALAEASGVKYSDAAAVNPNADSKVSSGHQNPYGKKDETLTSWAYSEYLWTHGYPVGNGRMAAMVAGGIDKEVIQVNEDTIWDGSPYGAIQDENGTAITNISQTKDAKRITTSGQTSGSVEDGWTYFRGEDGNGNPAPVGSERAIVGDAEFRALYPDFASRSISNQALNVNNAKETAAVQQRYQMERMVEATILGNPSKQKAYKSFAELYLDFGQRHQAVKNYTKSLDLTTGVVTVDYDYDGAHFTRETLASYPDQAVAAHVESDRELDFSAELHTYHNQSGYYEYQKVSDRDIKLTASVYNGNKNNAAPGSVNVIQFEAHMLLDGTGAFTVSDDNTAVRVQGGKEATVYLVGASNYVDYLNLDNAKPARDCAAYIQNLSGRSYQQIKSRHIADFSALFGSSSLSLDNAGGKSFSETPTDERIRKPINGKSGFTAGAGNSLSYAASQGVRTTYTEGDNQLAALEFNYGKYLLISGSRDGRDASGSEIAIPKSQPLNLTGKWNAALSASWNGKYTININTEMNYWAAQPLGLSSCERPLIDTFASLAQSGSITAANQYAVYNDRRDNQYLPGDPWVMHHNYDLWRGTQPIDNATAGLWPTGGAWLLDHAWQYYQFTHDTDYLAELYPYMVGAAKFFTQFLVVDPKTGYLVTAASCSPEQGGVQPGPAMDTQLVRNLYDMVRQSSGILNRTAENAALLSEISRQMPSAYLADEAGRVAPNLIDKNGLIQEWARGDVTFDFSVKKEGDSGILYTITNPFKNNETVYIGNHDASNQAGHRHCSHLWEMYPGAHLSAYSEDEDEAAVYKAFCKSVSARGAGSGQGWGLAWRIALNARAMDGDTASKMLEQLLVTRTSPDLIDQHPNFQIDGNFGATAGILEMLIQSHDGAVDVLPALPSGWQSGSFSGFKARGNVEVGAQWRDGAASEITLTPAEDGELSVRNSELGTAIIQDSKGNMIPSSLNRSENLRTFTAAAGETYTISNLGRNEPEYCEGTWTADVANAKDFFNAAGGRAPQLENNNTDVGYIVNNNKNGTSGEVGFSYPDCDLTGLTKLSINLERTTSKDTPYVSLRLDQKDGPVLCESRITGPGWLEMEVALPENVTGKHKIFAAFRAEGNQDTYIANAKDLKGYYRYKNPNYKDPVTAAVLTPYESGDGIAVKAAYDSRGALQGFDSQPVAAESGEPLVVEAPEGTKVMLWKDMSSMRPMAAPAVSHSGVIPPRPTSEPRPTPTAEPSPAPSDSPGTPSVFIGSESYDSIREALAAVDANPPKSESERVVIDLLPGAYREQLTVSSPYVTLRKKPGTDGTVLCTWYYGTNVLYDSCNEKGFYDPGAIDGGKTKYKASNWGAALNLEKSAHDFIADGIYFENSFNAYYTQEELKEGMEPSEEASFDRGAWLKEQLESGRSEEEINQFIQSRSPVSTEKNAPSCRERAAAFHSSADRVTVKNCTIMSKQDTIGIDNYRVYFENCKIGGTVDYICGSATAVFKDCELYWNAGPILSTSKSSDTDSGHITAPAQAVNKGYVFYNCRVTGSENATAGNFGRPWNANGEAIYINTTIGDSTRSGFTGKSLITDAGWTSMSGPPESARFGEYGSRDTSGKAISISNTLRKGLLLNEWTMLEYNPYEYMKGTDGWDPANMKQHYAEFEQVLENVKVDTGVSGNEITLPDPPNGYSYHWESDSPNAQVSPDGKKVSVIRPASGEQPVDTTITLYIRKNETEYGVKDTVSFQIMPTTDTENVYQLSGTVTMGAAAERDVEVSFLLSSQGAPIKTQTETIPVGQTSVSYVLEGIPAGSYDLRIIAAGNDVKVKNPVNGETAVTGAKGEVKTQDVLIGLLREKTVLIDPAQVPLSEAGPDGKASLTVKDHAYQITTGSAGSKTGYYLDIFSAVPQEDRGTFQVCDKIVVDYNLVYPSLPTAETYVDLKAQTPGAFHSDKDDSRFTRMRNKSNWKQIDMIDREYLSFSGSDNNDHQRLCITGGLEKAVYPSNNRIHTVIDFENSGIKVTGSSDTNEVKQNHGKELAFTGFPANVQRDQLYLVVYPNGANASVKLQDISITYSIFQ